MPDYEYDIFISYSRVGATSDWLKRHVVPILEELLYLELGRKAKVFHDGALSAGGTWPSELGQVLGRSRVLLALWSKPFLASDWCARELAVMRAREESLNLRSATRPNGTIAISVIHDGDTVPPELAMIQKFEIKDFYNTRMHPQSPLLEGLYEALRVKVPDLAAMIEAAPPFQDHWPQEAAEAFFEAFHQHQAARQASPPRFSI